MKVVLKFTVKSTFVDTFRALTELYEFFIKKVYTKSISIKWVETQDGVLINAGIIEIELTTSSAIDIKQLVDSLKKYCKEQLQLRLFDLLTIQADLSEDEYKTLKDKKIVEEL